MEAPHQRAVLAFVLTIFTVITMQTCCMAATSTTSTNKMYTNFIKSQCNTTTYPSVCNKALTSYASKVKTNKQFLSYAAMSVALQAARKASATVKKLQTRKGLTAADKSTVKDCAEELGDSIDELKQCLDLLKTIMSSKGSSDSKFQMENVKTWASAAITDEYTCTDELEEQNVSESVKKKISKTVVNVSRHTSNALSLINHLDTY